jgi:hypothetical protein
MAMEIKIIDLGMVNCYLLKTGAGFLLMDTGPANKETSAQFTPVMANPLPGNSL